LLAGFVRGNHAEPGGIVEDAAGAEGHAREDAHVAIHAGEAAIDVAEFALLLFENGNVGIFADGKRDSATVLFCGGRREWYRLR